MLCFIRVLLPRVATDEVVAVQQDVALRNLVKRGPLCVVEVIESFQTVLIQPVTMIVLSVRDFEADSNQGQVFI